MGNQIKVGVVGSAVFAPRNPERYFLEEALHAAAQAALRDAGITIEDIDGIVVASCDQQDGRAIAIMMASGSVGGVGRDLMSTPSCGEHAFVLGALRVRSGIFRTQLVLSWNPTETADLEEVQRLATDPYYHRKLPQDDLASHALQAVAIEAKVPGAREAAFSVVETNRRHGREAYPEYAQAPVQRVHIEGGRMLRYPISEGMVTPASFGVVAMVLASDDWIAEHKSPSPAWIQGMGWATEPAFIGDRDLSTSPSLRSATEQAYKEAGVSIDSPKFDVAEVSDTTPYQQLLALEGLGLCPREQWSKAVPSGRFAREGEMPVNLSGGSLTFNPLFASGLMRIAEAANQTRGKAGAHQKRDVKTAVAHGSSGQAMHYNTVVVFGHQPRENAQ
ncbi:MAG: thiolase family protein [Pseudomonadota bacterium]